MASVKLNDLTLTYNRHPAVHHVSGEFASGSLTAIAGLNGAGKSTLLKAIAGILKPNAGNISIDIDKSKIAYLPQTSEIERDFPLSVLQLVCSGYWQVKGSFGKIGAELRLKALDALELVGLNNMAERNIASLSTGQFQRVLFARLILQDAKIILLDEPFNAIDNATTASLMTIVKKWQAEQRTVICVLHNYQQIIEYFPNCLLLAKKCLAWGESKKVLADNDFLSGQVV